MKRCAISTQCDKLAAIVIHDARAGDTKTRKLVVCATHALWMEHCNDSGYHASIERQDVLDWLQVIDPTQARNAETFNLGKAS